MLLVVLMFCGVGEAQDLWCSLVIVFVVLLGPITLVFIMCGICGVAGVYIVGVGGFHFLNLW